MASKRDRLLDQIAAAKEERSRTIIAVAPEDDAAAAATHPDVLAIDARIRALRAAVAALDAEKEV